MIRLPHFELIAPTSLNDALQALAAGKGTTKLLAGGTDLVVNMKQSLTQPEKVVWLGKVPELKSIVHSEEGSLRIGAMCTLTEIGHSTHVRQRCPALARAAGTVASPQIRNQATIGGNICLATRCFYYDQSEFWRESLGYCLKLGDGICHAAPGRCTCTAVFSSDLAPLLIALGAKATISGSAKERTIPLAELYTNDGNRHLALESGEILTSVVIPVIEGVRSTHSKIRPRNAVDFPLVNVGISLTMSSATMCQNVRIVVGAVASAPLEFREFSSWLENVPLSEKLIGMVAHRYAEKIHPLPNSVASISYRKKMVEVLVRRGLRELLVPLSS